jgi:hypothetical protein
VAFCQRQSQAQSIEAGDAATGKHAGRDPKNERLQVEPAKIGSSISGKAAHFDSLEALSGIVASDPTAQPEPAQVPGSDPTNENLSINKSDGTKYARSDKRSRKPKLLDVETAQAILAEPFDEEAEADRAVSDTFLRNDDGTKSSLPGVLSIFLTGSTLDILGCRHVGTTKDPPVLMFGLSKETILADIQFRGAISDFHAHKQEISDADCDPVILRVNESDMYGDGNNFELALKQAAVNHWIASEEEIERRRTRDATIARRQLAQKSLPASKTQTKVRPLHHVLRSAGYLDCVMHQSTNS